MQLTAQSSLKGSLETKMKKIKEQINMTLFWKEGSFTQVYRGLKKHIRRLKIAKAS
jgi:hypothetical protein